MNDERLIAWLCVYRLQMDDDDDEHVQFSVPTAVHIALKERGWIDDKDSFTKAGLAVTDLHGADWGIDTIPETA